MRLFSLLFASALLTLSAARAEEGASAVIHADRPGPVIDRHIYGQFAEHLGSGIYDGLWVGEHSRIPNTRGFRNDVIAALRDLHVPVVRWPGGCFADEYHWRDGIGPRAKRPVTLNNNWGGVPESNQVGTHEFLDFAEQIGAEAYINGNLGTGSPREMAEWLHYLTDDKPTTLTAERARNGHPAPWKIAYFAVGNEAWGCGGKMRPDYYADLFDQTATFLKAPEGARPVVVASGGTGDDTSWTEALMRTSKDELGAISFHYYTLPSGSWKNKGTALGFGEDAWISTMAQTLRIEGFIAENAAIMDKYDPDRKIAFDIDEWGTWYDPAPGEEPGFLHQQNSLRDAVVAAANFAIFHRHADRVRMTNIAQMVNVLQSMILTRGPAMVLTPTYHLFRMFRPFQDAVSLPADLSTPDYRHDGQSVPSVILTAARSKEGAIIIALVNLDPAKPVPVSALFDGAAVSQVSGEILTAETMDAHNSFEHPDLVHPVPFHAAALAGGKLSLTLPSKSVLVLTLK